VLSSFLQLLCAAGTVVPVQQAELWLPWLDLGTRRGDLGRSVIFHCTRKPVLGLDCVSDQVNEANVYLVWF
jgi:hypothetical protein